MLDYTERLVSRLLVALARITAFDKVFNVSTHIRPGVVSMEESSSSVLTRVSSSRVIMLELEDVGMEVARVSAEVGYIDAVID